MHPIASNAEDLHAFETVTPGGVPLTTSMPSGIPRAGVVVLHEVWGMAAPVVALTVALADCGYTAAAPHLYHRIGDPRVTDGIFKKARRYHDTLTVDGVTSDIGSALAWTRAHGARKVAVVGFSMGGTLALWAAATLRIDAAVTFYGSGLVAPRWPGFPSGIDAARALKAPWLGIYGGRDTSTPARDLTQLREVLDHNTTPSELVIYPNVGHGFALDPDIPRHAPDETRDALERVSLFLKSHLR